MYKEACRSRLHSVLHLKGSTGCRRSCVAVGFGMELVQLGFAPVSNPQRADCIEQRGPMLYFLTYRHPQTSSCLPPGCNLPPRKRCPVNQHWVSVMQDGHKLSRITYHPIPKLRYRSDIRKHLASKTVFLICGSQRRFQRMHCVDINVLRKHQ